MFKVTRGYVLASTLTEAVKTDKKPYPVYSSQTKDNGLMGYYKDYLYEDAITWTTDGANAGTVNYRAGKFYCTNVCGVLLSNEVTANQMIAEALNNVAKGYVSYVGNPKLMNNVMADIEIMIPTQSEEREKLSVLFRNLDNLITLHQCKVFYKKVIFKNEIFNSFEFGNNIAWEQRKLYDIADRFDNLRIPVAANLRIHGITPYYGANGIQDYVSGYTHDGEFVLVAEDGANDLKNYPVNYVKGRIWVNNHAHVLQGKAKLLDNKFLSYLINRADIESLLVGCGRAKLNAETMMNIVFLVPKYEEQIEIGNYLSKIDNLITLHQRIKIFLQEIIMTKKTNSTISQNELFWVYFERWIKVYKDGAIRKVTMDKYLLALSWLKKLIPDLLLSGMDRIAYQRLLNEYAKTHERQTTMDFHHQLKGAILDAVDEGLIPRDPTRKAIIKGKTPRDKKPKYLSQFELHSLLQCLELGAEPNWDWLIMLVAKTGMRFSEALAITPRDFDFSHQTLSISKTWDYKGEGGFLPTKNKSSVRKIQIDWQTVVQFSELIKEKPADEPLFITCKVYNSTVNDVLKRRCKQAHIPTISIHGLRHTHASLLLFAGVTIASVARRLGHSSMTTTQKTYLHIIHELENKDIDLVMRAISSL